VSGRATLLYRVVIEPMGEKSVYGHRTRGARFELSFSAAWSEPASARSASLAPTNVLSWEAQQSRPNMRWHNDIDRLNVGAIGGSFIAGVVRPQQRCWGYGGLAPRRTSGSASLKLRVTSWVEPRSPRSRHNGRDDRTMPRILQWADSRDLEWRESSRTSDQDRRQSRFVRG
jgi:hypothetical protein